MKSQSSIAIVGLGGIFPGASDLSEFWRTIRDGVDTARDVDEDRWLLPLSSVYDAEVGAPDHVYSKRACFVDHVPRKSSMGLEVGSDILSGLDPAFHMLLHAGHQAYRDAKTDSLDPTRVGVIVGNLALPTDKSSAIAREYLGRSLEEKVLGKSRIDSAPSAHPLNRYVTGLPAGVLAKALGLKGGSLTLDAACASSLYALKLAVDELNDGRADAVLAGGLSRPDSLYTQMGFSQLRALSPTGTCSPFDARGNGLVVGEGSGIFLLKRLDDALRDDDHIYGVIRGIGLSNDIGGSLLAPMSDGQLRAMRAAYAAADWNPESVDLIECHATGTPVGDAVELESLRALWEGQSWDVGQCVIGSVKSNVGHLLTAAGSAALTKVLLAFQEKTLPPTANFESASPKAGLERSPFRVLTSSTPWHKRDISVPRRAAVSAFGFGGINAHVLVEEWDDSAPVSVEPPVEVMSDPPAVAIVGMGAHFGEWSTLRSFQERVLGGGQPVDPESPKHWWGADESAWYKLQGLSRFPFKGHYLRDFQIARDKFRIPPKELEEMLPQQLLMLEVAAEALRDSGLNPDVGVEQSARRGVFIGLGLDLNTTNYSFRWSLANKATAWAQQLGLNLSDEELENWIQSLRDSTGPALSANRTMGGLGSIVASRIAREFKFGGPSFALSAEESSGIRALETAVRRLQGHEIDVALAGAVDLAGDIRAVLAAHRGRAYSASGVTRPFDARADGAVVGEGAAAVTLKRVEDAARDGDRIYAVIKGVGTASGGGVEGQVPTESAYRSALERAYAEAKVSPDQVSYLETHGSGCPEEDRMEASALAHYFRGNDEADLLVLGSAKADIGHSGAASGMASLVKGALALYQETLPPLRHHDQPLTELASQDARLLAPSSPAYWLRDTEQGSNFAGVSSFSVDGNCSHVVLESWEHEWESSFQPERLQPLGARQEALFAIEANNIPTLLVALGRLRVHVENAPNRNIEALARQWWKENREDSQKLLGAAFLARNGAELLQQIEYAQHSLSNVSQRAWKSLEGAPPNIRDRVFFSPQPIGHDGKVAFVFPGSGNQYLGMGRGMSVQWPEVFRKQDSANRTLFSQYQPDLFWRSNSVEAMNQDHKAALFGQVALGTAVSDLIQSFGVRPQAVVGYSLGETAGLFALNAWTDRDLMLDRINASTLFTEDLAGSYNAARKAWKVPSTKTVDWALGVIDRPAKVVRAGLQDHKKVYSLIVNTLHECVVGGDPHAVAKLVKKLDCEFFPLHGVTTVHCEVAKEVQEPYRALHLLNTTPPDDIQFYSGAWGTAYNVSRESAADSVLAQAIYGIDYPKMIEAAYEDGVRAFIEMGPGASCSRMIGEILKDRPHMARSACHQGQDAVSSVLRVLGELIAERVPIDLAALYGQESAVVDHQTIESDESALHFSLGGKPFSVVLPTDTPEEIADPIPAEEASVESFSPTADLPSPHEIIEPATTDQWTSRIPSWEPAASTSDQGTTVIAQLVRAEAQRAEAHESYLRFAKTTTETLTRAVSLQMRTLEKALAGETLTVSEVIPVEAPTPPAAPPAEAPLFDRDLCMEIATGSIAKVLGKKFAEVDTFPTRVRLPDEPLMLVDRIQSIHGEALSMEGGRIVTEHDVLPGAWYLDGGRAPTCISVEAGQADLFLSGYLGIDFETRGLAVYRLLDAVVTFHDALPTVGQTIRYDIRIERFFRQGDTYLFRFNFDATVDGRPVLSMREGIAGFFTDEQLSTGQGVVQTTLATRPAPGKLPDDWQLPLPMARETYSSEQMEALRSGDLAACFGPLFAQIPVHHPVTLPAGRMKLVDRILDLEPEGGRFSLGKIRGEMDIYPDDWFLTCHFVDDKVMPGTLMFECCLHTLRTFLMRMGWVAEADHVTYEPVSGVASQLKCRGQVMETTEKVVYEITLKELGYNPNAFAIADALMYADGKPVVEIINMSVQLTGLTRERVDALWHDAPASAPTAPPVTLYDSERILAYAVGSLEQAFGEPYRIFDHDRIIARLPGPPYLFMDRVTRADAQPWSMKPGGEIEAEYDVPADAWYFSAERSPRMPFAILLEVALQPCGWFAAYMGSALTSETDLHFRNLGGEGTQHVEVGPGIGTLTTRVRCTGVSSSGGMIIQHFDLQVSAGDRIVYEGTTYFGFFSASALENQIGLGDADLDIPSKTTLQNATRFEYPRSAPYPDDQLRMVDKIECYDSKGGANGLGYIQGAIDVDPDAWFFKAHFYQDPVWPGSLGLEAFLQLMKYVACERWGVGPSPRFETALPNDSHSWVYRGQVIPKDGRVTVHCSVTKYDDDTQTMWADGHLVVDGRVIYSMSNFSTTLKE